MAAIFDCLNFLNLQKTTKIDRKVIYHLTWCGHENTSFEVWIFVPFTNNFNFYILYHIRISLFVVVISDSIWTIFGVLKEIQ